MTGPLRPALPVWIPTPATAMFEGEDPGSGGAGSGGTAGEGAVGDNTGGEGAVGSASVDVPATTFRIRGRGAAAARPPVEVGLAWVQTAAAGNRPWREARPGEEAALCIECEDGAAALGLETDESYRLTTEGRSMHLRAATQAGVSRGLATLAQLAAAGDRTLSRVDIVDRPRFRWRGLMLDVARHFFPADEVCRQLDAMARFKLNVLHLHLTDDQGFRVESRAFPRLHERGSRGAYYRRDDVRRIVSHAMDRGIRVVPEFDLPGHASSWLAGYPELGCDPERVYEPVTTWGCVDVCFDPSNEALYDFLAAFFADVLPLFPDACVHLGGDEVTGGQWRAAGHLAAWMDEEGWAAPDLQARFQTRVHGILQAMGKRSVGWDEVVHPDGPRGIIAQAWRGEEAMGLAAAAGHESVRSHGFYLNALQPAQEHYDVDPEAGVAASHRARVLGGEACMWTEFVDGGNLDTRLWPRLAAIAERLWSPAALLAPAALEAKMQAASAQLRRAGHAVDGPTVAQVASRLGLQPQRRDAVLPSGATDQSTPLDALADLIPVESSQAAACRALVRAGDRAGLSARFEALAEALGKELAREGDEGAATSLDSRGGSALAVNQLRRAHGRTRRLVAVGRTLLAADRTRRAGPRTWAEAASPADLRRRLARCATPWMGLCFALVDPLIELLEQVSRGWDSGSGRDSGSGWDSCSGRDSGSGRESG